MVETRLVGTPSSLTAYSRVDWETAMTCDERRLVSRSATGTQRRGSASLSLQWSWLIRTGTPHKAASGLAMTFAPIKCVCTMSYRRVRHSQASFGTYKGTCGANDREW